MYSTFLTASPGSVLFSRSTLIKRKDLCFSCLRLGLIRHRRSSDPHNLSQSILARFSRVKYLESWYFSKYQYRNPDSPPSRTVFCDWFASNVSCQSVSPCSSTESQVTCFVVFRQLNGLNTSIFINLCVICSICSKTETVRFQKPAVFQDPTGDLGPHDLDFF